MTLIAVSQVKRVLIRDMRENDLRRTLEIERLSFPTPWSETSFLSEIHRPRSLTKVAVVNRMVVGYICAGYVLDEGYILDIAVDPDYRKKGIATALVRTITTELRLEGCRCVYLEVRASNEAAKKLYEGSGFTLVGTRKKYYKSPEEDALIMMLRL